MFKDDVLAETGTSTHFLSAFKIFSSSTALFPSRKPHGKERPETAVSYLSYRIENSRWLRFFIENVKGEGNSENRVASQ